MKNYIVYDKYNFDFIDYLEQVYTSDLSQEEKDVKIREGFELYREDFKRRTAKNLILKLEELYPKKTLLQKVKDFIYNLTHIEIDFT